VKIGLVGKPNVGKSTFFKAATLKDVAIADYPFTTIQPNHGIGYVRAKCPHVDFGVACNPQHGLCLDGTRFVPVELVDVAGLVPGAHTGRGLGNKFLDDLRQAHAFVHVVDATGASNEEGQAVAPGTHDPQKDLDFLEGELTQWIKNILTDGWERLAKRAQSAGEKLERLLAERLTGLGFTEAHLHAALRDARLDAATPAQWKESELVSLADTLRRIAKPTLVALNKSDKVEPAAAHALRQRLGADRTVLTSADSEVALRGAAKAGLVRYLPGAATFELEGADKLNPKQRQALDYIRTHVLEPYGGTGVLQALERAAYGLLNQIVVYPVEDEGKLTDKKGNILPDAHLVPKGSTARDLAYRVHTDLGKNFIRAIDARTKRAIAADHALGDADVVRIVANA
jgi:ribosome-binding ATPase